MPPMLISSPTSPAAASITAPVVSIWRTLAVTLLLAW